MFEADEFQAEALRRSGLSRRQVLRVATLSAPVLMLARRGWAAGEAAAPLEDSLAFDAGTSQPFPAAESGIVGVFDVDWLAEPRFTRLLDTMAASPGAFRAVRFFGALNPGTRERVFPTDSGPNRGDPAVLPDFGGSLDAIAALLDRGLLPFVALTFFPVAVSPSPIGPPDLSRWRTVVRGFLDAAAARFGADEVARWWFEAWNEPNMPPFWSGDFATYLDLYRATSEVVMALDYRIRLGGPVLAYTPGKGAALMERFLRFLHAEPQVRCDFVSLHRKGSWSEAEGAPELERLEAAARETAEAVLRIVPERARNLLILNDEADMRVAFDRPFAPRMTEQFPAWLAASLVLHEGLNDEWRGKGLRFAACADDANQQLVRAPFDGRRSVMTQASASPTDLLKLPVFGFYELYRLLGDRRSAAAGPDPGHPGLYRMPTLAATHAAVLFARYDVAGTGTLAFDYTLHDLPWTEVNVALFMIGPELSNAWAAAGGQLSPTLTPAQVRHIRERQELAVAAPLRSRVPCPDRTLALRLEMAPLAAGLLWVTPVSDAVPEAPERLQATVEDGNVVLHWTPDAGAAHYSYEVFRDGTSVAPTPLRGATWVDTAPPRGSHRYEVRGVSASGVIGPLRTGPVVTV